MADKQYPRGELRKRNKAIARLKLKGYSLQHIKAVMNLELSRTRIAYIANKYMPEVLEEKKEKEKGNNEQENESKNLNN